MNLGATHRMSSVADLRDVYDAKCAQLGVQANTIVRQRLEILDASQGTTLDLSSVVLGPSFECAMEVAALSSSMRTIDLTRTNLTDHEVDILVHNLRRSVNIRELVLSGNPRITDKGGLYLLDIAHARGTITNLHLDGTGISQKMMQRLDIAVDENIASAGNEVGGHDQLALSHHLASSGGSPNQWQQQLVTASNEAFRVVVVSAKLSLIVTRAAEGVLSVLCWDNTFKTLCILAVCFVSIFSGHHLFMWPLVLSLLLLQHRVQFPRSHDVGEPHHDVRAVSPLQRAFYDVRRMRRRLEASDPADVGLTVYVESVINGIINAFEKIETVEFRRNAAGAVCVLSVAAMLVPAYVLCALFVFALFGFHLATGPIQGMTLLSLPAPSPARARRALMQHSAEDEALRDPFPFAVQLICLVGIEAEWVSKRQFIPFVQMKYNRRSWVSRRVHEPWQWDEESFVMHFKPGVECLSFKVFDDAGDMVGPLCTGDVIIDETLRFDESIFVQLHPAERMSSVLRELVDEIEVHRAATRSQYMQVASSTAGAIPQVILAKPGSLVIRVRRIGVGDGVLDSNGVNHRDASAAAQSESSQATASCDAPSAPARVPPLPLPPDGRWEQPSSIENSEGSAARPESIVREASNGVVQSARVIYHSEGRGSVPLPKVSAPSVRVVRRK